MSTQNLSKKVFVSALVAIPFPFILAWALEQASALPGNISASAYISGEQGPSYYVLAWALTTLACALSSLFTAGASTASSVASNNAGGESDEDSGPEGKETGTVKWFNVNKGFGFITTAAGDDIFVHFRSIRGRGRRSLRQGQDVRFDISEGDKGLQADNVSVLDK